MGELRDALGQVLASVPHRTWAVSAPIDARKVRAEYEGFRRPSATSSYARGLIRLARLDPPAPVVVPSETSLMGFVRDISHVGPGTPVGKAFVSVPVVDLRVLLQFADPVSDLHNRAGLPDWTYQWAKVRVAVEGWWRVNHRTANSPPPVASISAWWPNAEDMAEVARLDAVYQDPSIAGLVTLGKIPVAMPPPGRPVQIECFKEGPSSDQNVTNCVAFWLAKGVPVNRIVVMIQGYGTPFSPPVEQAEQAFALGIRHLALYPLDGFTPADITAIGNQMGSLVTR